jgi:Tetratricopeptide repeat/Thioredoxin-like domain
VYPDPDVVQFISENFLPVRVHVREQADEFKQLGQKFGAQWTPTILLIDDSGTERHRVEGFLPKEDFLGQLTLGIGHSAFARGKFPEARRWFDQVLERYPETEAAPEAQYWTGVAEYKETDDGALLAATAKRFTERYSDTSWAKKSSVWRR